MQNFGGTATSRMNRNLRLDKHWGYGTSGQLTNPPARPDGEPQLANAARKFVRPDDLTWLVVGDLGKIEKGVRSLGWGDVVVLDAEGNPLPR
ncbi:MAG: hypothetical protein JWQ01_2091 [Massilia sp.]|nr:hypothetical protein [Massilia sp.]